MHAQVLAFFFFSFLGVPFWQLNQENSQVAFFSKSMHACLGKKCWQKVSFWCNIVCTRNGRMGTSPHLLLQSQAKTIYIYISKCYLVQGINLASLGTHKIVELDWCFANSKPKPQNKMINCDIYIERSKINI